ncbi:glycosyltransferase [Tahibacter harae]|uniref:Glycosyltransferase n=1 Tax=Tahibacter harae TaxID=2963937 RepID=A0ABT1QTQ1_9GAMM|nr:glycosyltransferase [Tahibacter harae]MCQ4165682.1 glycosyltransferase [Tahibacter harae]
MNAAPRASLIVLAWNRWELTRRALDSLLRCDLGDSEILVVDNGSSDATAQELGVYADRVRVLRLARNLGYVRGNNAGIAAAAADSDIVLLNNDLVFTQADWLAKLRACVYAAGDCGIAGCRLVDDQGHLLHAGTRVLPDDGIGVQTPSGRIERDVGQYSDADRVVEGVVFAAVYIRRAVIDAIGPLHSDYDTYAEDSDYCLRARAAGWHTRLCGGVTLRHDQHGSTADDAARRGELLRQGRETFARHWLPALRAQYGTSLRIHGALDFPQHVARWLRPLARALDAAGIRLSYQSLYAPVLPEAIAEPGDSRDHLLNTLRRRGAETAPAAALCVGDIALWPQVQAAYRIGLADFETPPDVREQAILHAMDELWAPSGWHRRELERLGLGARLRDLPWGVDAAYAHPGLRAPRAADGDCVVLCIAAWDELDRPWRLLQAWTRRFRREDRLRLLLWLDPAGSDIATATRELALDVHGGRYDIVLQPRLAEEAQQVVFAAADVVISTSRANSRCWALLQALATARPLVAVARGAAAEWLQRHAGRAVDADDVSCEDAVLAALDEVLADLPAARARALRASGQLRIAADWRSSAQIARKHLARPFAPVPRAPAAPAQGRVIVLGMHRSGTSCVAGLLHMLGAYAGEPGSFLVNAAENARGFLERGDLHLACVGALRRRGGDWSIPLGWDETALPAARAQWRADWRRIQAELELRSPWLVKEPRLCLLLDEVADLIGPCALVHVVRAPDCVAASVCRRHGLQAPQALALWEHYNRAAAQLCRDRPALVLDYHCLLQQPQPQVRRLYRRLCDYGVQGLRLPSAEEIAAWVAPQLARERSPRGFAPSAAQQALWQALRRRAADEDVPLPPADAGAAALLQQLGADHRAAMAAEQERGG